MEYLLEISKTMRNFHQLGLIHRDVKPNNFLYNRNLKRAYLIDFGLSHPEIKTLKDLPKFENLKLSDLLNEYLNHYLSTSPKIHKMGTDGYLPPEILLERPEFVCKSSDNWALGVIMAQLFFTKEHIFTSNFLVYSQQSQKVKNLKNPQVMLMIQLAAIFGVDYVQDFVKNFDLKLKLPSIIDQYLIEKVVLLVEE